MVRTVNLDNSFVLHVDKHKKKHDDAVNRNFEIFNELAKDAAVIGIF